MTWNIRHEGSPRMIEGLTAAQVVEGLQDALWEPTDEVMGPHDAAWVAIESHPEFADVAADLEPPPVREHDDETRLDMNPLIDVCLVLLIFFILTTSYVALQKILDMPGVSSQKVEGPPKMTMEEVAKFTINVKARQEDGKPVIRVEDVVTPLDDLVPALKSWVRKTHKTELLLDAQGVDWGTVVAIQDAAKGAGVQRVNFQVGKEDLR